MGKCRRSKNPNQSYNDSKNTNYSSNTVYDNVNPIIITVEPRLSVHASYRRVIRLSGPPPEMIWTEVHRLAGFYCNKIVPTLKLT